MSIDDNESTKDDFYMVKIEGDDDEEDDNDEYEYEEQEATDTPSSEEKKEKEPSQAEKTDEEINKISLKNFKIKEKKSYIKNPNNNALLLRDLDNESYCHYIYRKGNYVDLSEIKLFSCMKYKPKKSLFKKNKAQNGTNNNITYSKIKYLLLLDENFLYMLNEKVWLKKRNTIRKIKNSINLKQINRLIITKEDNNKLKITIEIYKDECLYIDEDNPTNNFYNKIYEFDEENSKLFIEQVVFLQKKIKIEYK